MFFVYIMFIHYYDNFTIDKHLTQKFSAHIPSVSEGKTFGMFQESASLIPRQKFLLLTLSNKQVKWSLPYLFCNVFCDLTSQQNVQQLNILLIQWISKNNQYYKGFRIGTTVTFWNISIIKKTCIYYHKNITVTVILSFVWDQNYWSS